MLGCVLDTFSALDKLGIEKRDLIEKDILLQMLLNELIKNKDFKDNFTFKGGTCLIKNYFGYFRFSEDLDFTYLNQKGFRGISKKKIREVISRYNKIKNWLSVKEKITEDLERFLFKKTARRPMVLPVIVDV